MRIRAVARALVVVAALAADGAVAGCGDDGPGGFGATAAGDGPADLRYEVPPGAGAALDAGTPLEVLPARLDVEVGDVIEIVNHDGRGHLIGPFPARPGGHGGPKAALRRGTRRITRRSSARTTSADRPHKG